MCGVGCNYYLMWKFALDGKYGKLWWLVKSFGDGGRGNLKRLQFWMGALFKL
jgi:hypothetical protein